MKKEYKDRKVYYKITEYKEIPLGPLFKDIELFLNDYESNNVFSKKHEKMHDTLIDNLVNMTIKDIAICDSAIFYFDYVLKNIGVSDYIKQTMQTYIVKLNHIRENNLIARLQNSVGECNHEFTEEIEDKTIISTYGDYFAKFCKICGEQLSGVRLLIEK